MSDILNGRGALDQATTHGVKNQLAIILGFCELLSRTIAEADPRRHDLRQIEIAGRKALMMLTHPAHSGSGHHDERM